MSDLKKGTTLTVIENRSSDSQATTLLEKRILLITPVRDEEKFIEGMLESIIRQRIPPAKWIIVDDGSTDATPAILAEYARQNQFIHVIRLSHHEERRPGGESAIAQALNGIDLTEYDFIARFDADLIFQDDYINKILHQFDLDYRLGIAGGGLFIEDGSSYRLEEVPDYHVRGALKMYRRECFQQIGGLNTRIGWDTIDEVSAWTYGWTTKSFFDCAVIHRRPTGRGLDRKKICWERGRAEYFTCSHPLFVIAKAGKVLHNNRSLAAALRFLAGFFGSYLKSTERLRDPVFRKLRRQQQSTRITSALKSLIFDRKATRRRNLNHISTNIH